MPFFSRSLLTSCTTLMLVTACISSLMVSTSNALKEETLSAIKQLNDPLVVLFHDGTNSEDYENALDVMKETERRVTEFDYYTCNTREKANARSAKQSNLADGVHIFVRTREDGVEEYRMPITIRHLSRYLYLRGVAGNPANVLAFESEDHIYDLVDRSGLPVFLKFYEPWCSHCFRMKRGFEAGATFFKNRVHFMEVQCSRNKQTQAFCRKHEVDIYPSMKLFTGSEVIPFTGSRAVAAYEFFFHEHKHLFPENSEPGVTKFNVGQDLNEEEEKMVGHGYPMRSEEVGIPDREDVIREVEERFRNHPDAPPLEKERTEIRETGQQRREERGDKEDDGKDSEQLKSEVDELKGELKELKDMMKQFFQSQKN
eukprot:gb/GECG01014234.1/.p1 GENE.gb/GECG01014234.1/~~gb/GECG01014234.1/.p1  ORF type:complete len:371 (+),score=55.68 gb/GECG01014234.1/:1-1113(+)